MKAPTPPRVLCVIGTGVQARSHVEALRVIHNFQEVCVYTVTCPLYNYCGHHWDNLVS